MVVGAGLLVGSGVFAVPSAILAIANVSPPVRGHVLLRSRGCGGAPWSGLGLEQSACRAKPATWNPGGRELATLQLRDVCN
jgi:hypothetical protein